jgi:hypothetical protein
MIAKRVNDMFSMQNTPGGQRFAETICFSFVMGV